MSEAMAADGQTIRIREARKHDGEAVKEVFEAAFAPLRSIYRPTGDAIARQEQRALEGIRLVAECGGEVIATVQLAIHDEHIHVIGLAVSPRFQQRGIGRQLIESIANRAPALGRRTVVLDTIRETGNVPVFESMEFRVIRETVATWCTSDTFPELHDVMMERIVG